MGINIPANSSLGSIYSQFFSLFFFSAKMNLTVFVGILLAVTMTTARRASLGEKTMKAAGKAEPGEAMKEAARPASLFEKIMRAADKADEPDEADEAKRESWPTQPACTPFGETCYTKGGSTKPCCCRGSCMGSCTGSCIRYSWRCLD